MKKSSFFVPPIVTNDLVEYFNNYFTYEFNLNCIHLYLNLTELPVSYSFSVLKNFFIFKVCKKRCTKV